jgi:hypothetical protein
MRTGTAYRTLAVGPSGSLVRNDTPRRRGFHFRHRLRRVSGSTWLRMASPPPLGVNPIAIQRPSRPANAGDDVHSAGFCRLYGPDPQFLAGMLAGRRFAYSGSTRYGSTGRMEPQQPLLDGPACCSRRPCALLTVREIPSGTANMMPPSGDGSWSPTPPLTATGGAGLRAWMPSWPTRAGPTAMTRQVVNRKPDRSLMPALIRNPEWFDRPATGNPPYSISPYSSGERRRSSLAAVGRRSLGLRPKCGRGRGGRIANCCQGVSLFAGRMLRHREIPMRGWWFT